MLDIPPPIACVKGPGKFGIVKTQKEAAILLLLLSGHPILLP